MLKSQNVSVRARLNSWEERWVPWGNRHPCPISVRPRAQKGNGEKERGILDVALSSFLLLDLGEKWGKKERRRRLPGGCGITAVWRGAAKKAVWKSIQHRFFEAGVFCGSYTSDKH